jgi:hypothetical protein
MSTQLETFGTVTLSVDENASTASLACARGWNADGAPDFDAAVTFWEDLTCYERDSEGVLFRPDDRPDGGAVITLDWSELAIRHMAERTLGMIVEAPRPDPLRPPWR